MSVFDETIVRIETDVGIDGWGDSVPWGSNFVAAFARGVRAVWTSLPRSSSVAIREWWLQSAS